MNLKQLVNDKELWDEFVAELEIRVQNHYRTMANLNDYESMCRHQGAIHELQRLKMLREKVNAKPN